MEFKSQEKENDCLLRKLVDTNLTTFYQNEAYWY